MRMKQFTQIRFSLDEGGGVPKLVLVGRDSR